MLKKFMTEKLKQTMNTEITKLPKERQEAINSLDWGKESEEIGKKFSFTDDEINNLQVETGLVLVGLANLDTYKQTIEESLRISRDEAEKISQAIFDRIFKPVSEKILSSVKSTVRLNNVSWDKTVNFIISGGDYSVFLDK